MGIFYKRSNYRCKIKSKLISHLVLKIIAKQLNFAFKNQIKLNSENFEPNLKYRRQIMESKKRKLSDFIDDDDIFNLRYFVEDKDEYKYGPDSKIRRTDVDIEPDDPLYPLYDSLNRPILVDEVSLREKISMVIAPIPKFSGSRANFFQKNFVQIFLEFAENV